MKPNQVYCVRCKEACVPNKITYERDARDRLRMKGSCPYCATRCYKYVSESSHPKKRRY